VIRGGAGQDNTVVEAAIHDRDARKRAYDLAKRRGQSAPPPFEHVWCVFDREGERQTPHFWRAVRHAENETINLAISNPSFEYWYLLHFRDTGEFFQHGEELKRALRQYLPDYDESADVFGRLFQLTDTALERAERRYEQHPERDQDRYPNPSTTVYQLVNSLRKR
jgi:hypothetical protein